MSASGDKPIVLYPIHIVRGVKYKHNCLEADFRNRFSKYGKIWSLNVDEIELEKRNEALSPIQIKISFGNAKSRDLAMKWERGKLYDNRVLCIRPRFAELYDLDQIIAKKQRKPHIDINKLMDCNKYWDKQSYPTDIIREALQNPSNEFYSDPTHVFGDVMLDRKASNHYLLFCLHPSIQYPFLNHLCSPTRSVENVLHVRRQCVNEIARMLWNPNIKRLRRVLPHNFAFGVDWKRYNFTLLWGRTLFSNYLRSDPEPFECIQHMINVIGVCFILVFFLSTFLLCDHPHKYCVCCAICQFWSDHILSDKCRPQRESSHSTYGEVYV